MIARSHALLAAAVSCTACSAILGLQEPAVDNTIEGGADSGGTDSGGTDVGADVPNTCGADLQTDKKNCGACGHDCLGGDCTGGKCQPLAILFNTSVYAPAKMAVDATYVYFANPYYGTVSRVGKDGSNPTTIASGLVQPWSVTVTASNVYIADLGTGASDGSVLSCPLAGCGANNANATKIVSGSSDEPSFVAVDNNDVFVAFGVDVPNGRIGHCTLPCSSGPTTFAGNMATPDYVRVAGGQVYWTTEGGGIYGCAVGASCTTATLLVPEWGAYALAVDSTSLYWTTLYDSNGDATKAHLGSGPLAGTQNPTQIATDQRIAIGMFVDSSHVYWATRGTDPNYQDGTVARCPLAGCGPSNASLETLASGLSDPRDIVDDGSAVFFGTYGDGTIWKLAK